MSVAIDALDPGEDGTYPNLDLSLQPRGLRQQRTPDGRIVLVDVEATNQDGTPVHDLKGPE